MTRKEITEKLKPEMVELECTGHGSFETNINESFVSIGVDMLDKECIIGAVDYDFYVDAEDDTLDAITTPQQLIDAICGFYGITD